MAQAIAVGNHRSLAAFHPPGGVSLWQCQSVSIRVTDVATACLARRTDEKHGDDSM